MRIASFGAAAVLAAGALVASPVAPSATAQPLESGHFHDVWSEDFICESNGLPIREDGDVSGSFVFNERGPKGLAYFRESLRGTITWTNLADGGTYSTTFASMNMDQKITDLGDGVIQIDTNNAGGAKYFDNTGKMVLRDPGNIRFRIVIDTINEEELSFEVLRESTGLNETDGRDFCEDVVIFSAVGR
jgi:hypothetical protein